MRRATMTLFTLITLALASLTHGQKFDGEISRDEYLALLERISPVARRGVEQYLAAYRSRCGRDLRVVELRQALASDTPDPVLLGLIRATHTQDNAAARRSLAGMVCREGD